MQGDPSALTGSVEKERDAGKTHQGEAGNQKERENPTETRS